jgi:hypothetical protein
VSALSLCSRFGWLNDLTLFNLVTSSNSPPFSFPKLTPHRPRLRDALCQSHNQPHFDVFFIPYTTSMSVNWPYCDSDVLLPSTFQPSASSPGSTSSSQADEPAWRMNPAFETHIRNLSNWSLGPAFRETFPQLADTVKILDS